MTWPGPEDLMPTGGWRPAVAALGMGLLFLVAAGGGGYLWGRRTSERESLALQAQAQALQEAADAARRDKAQAQAEAHAAGVLAAERGRQVARLQAQLAALPPDPGPRPVDPGTSAALALAELAGLGLRPVPLGDPLALGLTLPDTLTTLKWGREAQRVPFLVSRLGTLEQLVPALEGATGALHQQVASLTTAMEASDREAAADRRRAQALEGALRLRPISRPWTIGYLRGLDAQGRQHHGAYLGWSYLRLDAQLIYINRTTAAGLGVRF
jgi:type II secretory pathway pseudopilin PulG